MLLTSLVLTSGVFAGFVYNNRAIAEDIYSPQIEIETSHNKLVETNISSTFQQKPQIEVSSPTESEIASAMDRESLEEKVDYLHSYLSRKNSSVFSRDIVRIIIQIAEEYGADYRIIVAIMGKESGYCNANYKIYNCFGYLNGAQYSSFEEAFRTLTPKIAKIVGRNGWNIAGIASEYKPVDQVGWTNRVYKMASEI